LPRASSAAASIRSPRPSSRRRPSAQIEPQRVDGFDAPAGKGALGMVERRRVVLGNAEFFAELGIAADPLRRRRRALRGDGARSIFVAVDGKLAGLIAIADPIKPTTPRGA
jgi:Cu+-exporting ATPase